MAKSRITEKFTARAKKVLNSSIKFASELGNDSVDTEHILLAILDDNENSASKILSEFGVDFNRIRETIYASVEKGQNSLQEGFTESSQEALASAALAAYLWGSNYVGTEHILCGLSRITSGLACHILRSFGITYDSLKAKTESLFLAKALDPKQKQKSTPLLNTYSQDLTSLAGSNSLDPVIGREVEISRLLQILSRRTKNNPVLLGESGVGKTAIVEGLAQKIAQKQVPQKFWDSLIVGLDLNALVAGTRFRGDFEERLLGVMEEIKEAGNIIVFIDEIQNLVGAGGAGGALDAANILKPALAKGDLRIIGATTIEDYSKYVEGDSALERRFQPILVDEPDEETAIQILNELKNRYEDFHGVKIHKGALVASVKMAKRYLTARHLPDSAIDILDEAASKLATGVTVNSPALANIENSLNKIKTQKDELVTAEEYEEALFVREKERELSSKLEKIIAKVKVGSNRILKEEDIASVVSEMTGIPVEEIGFDEAEKYLNLEKILKQSVVGQDQTLRQVSSVIRRSRVGLSNPNRPLGSFIFLGTSGVGKTLVAKELAKILFSDDQSLIRLDMAEFSERHTVSRLIGAPPGYVGFEEGGELTESLRRKPYQVILFDEIEKAHSEIFNTLLSVLEEGELVDGRGRLVDFRNCVIIMTSNIGSDLIRKTGTLGFNKKRDTLALYKDISTKLLEELKGHFRPEFLNRVDSIAVFKPLDKKDATKIARLQIKELGERLATKKIKLKIDNKALEFLADKGFSSESGAREIRRVVVEYLENPISEGILKGKFKKGEVVKVFAEKKGIGLKAAEK